MRILVVEDDAFVAHVLMLILNSQHYVVDIAVDGQLGFDLAAAFDFDLIVLDVMLPKLDGISLCRKLRANDCQVPILLLTACAGTHEKAVGLDAGADDYMGKPFDQEELLARVRALLRRGSGQVKPTLEWDDLRLDPQNHAVTYANRQLTLTPKEYAMLELFMRNSRHIYSCEALIDHVWSYEKTPGEECVRTHIKGLRHKLKAAGAPIDFIETIYGAGYRLKQKTDNRVR